MKVETIVKVICASVFIVSILIVCAGVLSNDPITTESTEYQQEDDFVSDYLLGEENFDGNTCENLKYGAIVAKQGSWLYHRGDEGLYKTNMTTGETVVLISGELVTDISVCKDYVYFILWDGFAEGVFRIRTDGKNREKITDARSYFFENQYLYYTESTPIGISEWDYSVVRKNVDSITSTEEVYDLGSGEYLAGVYNGYAIIGSNDEIVLCDTKTLNCQSYDWNGLTRDMHFDNNKLICVDESSMSIFDISTKEISEEKFYSELKLRNVNNGKYYFTFYTGSQYVLGYTYPSWIDGSKTNLVKLDSGNISDYVNVIDDYVYYAGDNSMLELVKIVRVDTSGDNFELIWSRD